MAEPVAIYRHFAATPDRWFYDQQKPNYSGWSNGTVAFYAFHGPEPGTEGPV